jgi:hypothetical protein
VEAVKSTNFLPYIFDVRPALLPVLLVGLLGAGAAGAGEPVLHVKARMRIDVSSVARVPGGIVVSGVLVDSALEEPIPGRTVAISVDGLDGAPGFYRYAEPTSDDGTFRWRVPLQLGRYTLRLAAGGDDEYAGAPIIERVVDIARRTPIVSITSADTVSIREDRLVVRVTIKDPPDELADSDEHLQVPLALSMGARPLGSGITSDGELRLEVPVHELGPAGTTVQLTARFAGDALRNPAEAGRPVLVTCPTSLSLAADSGRVASDEEVTLSGKLEDALGASPDALIDVEMGQKVLASGVTGSDGRWRVTLKGAELGLGPKTLGARFRGRGFREPSESPPVTLAVHGPSLRASPLYLVPPLLTALALGGLALLRRRPWVLVAARLRARMTRPAPQSGLSEGRTRLFQTLRPASDYGLAGQVCDSATLSPIAGATLVVGTGGQRRAVLSDDEGRFAVEALPAGTLEVEVAAAGYVSERFDRTIPHRGELRGARVLLQPIRLRIFAAWDRAARPLLPKTEIYTPREVLGEARKKQLITEDLAALTAAVETSCYGPEAPGVEALAKVEALVERVKPAGG